MGLKGEVLMLTVRVVRVMLIMPVLIMVRNLYHGKMMVRRKTTGMALAALLRVLAIAGLSKLLLETGRLTAMTGAVVLVAGFLAETLMVRRSTRRSSAR
jgi:hypothetical protein